MDRNTAINNIQIYTDKFTVTGFFPDAMQAFNWAHAYNLPIPNVILDAIAKGFAEWTKNDGAKGYGLDDIFGLRAGCSGHTSVLTNKWTEDRVLIILNIMETLIALGLNKTYAARAAHFWLCEQYRKNPKKYRGLKPNNSGRKNDDSESREPVTLNTINKNIWEKRNSTYSEIYKEAKRIAKQSKDLWSNEEQQKFLDLYLNLFPLAEREKIKISSPKPLDVCYKDSLS